MAVTFKLLSTTSWSNNSQTVTVSGISQDYTDLWIHMWAKNNPPTNQTRLRLQINGVSSSTYGWRALTYTGGSSASYGNQDYNGNGIYSYGAFATGDWSGAHSIIYIPSYSSSTWRKIMYTFSYAGYLSSNSTSTLGTGMGVNASTAAITSLSFINDNGGTTASGSYVKIYGIARQ